MNGAYIPGRTPPPNETGDMPATPIERAINDIRQLDVTDPSFELKLINAAVRDGIPLTEFLIDYVFSPETNG